jgi:translation initiation factor 4G
MDPYQPQPPWGYYAMPSQHMHQQPHPQHVPHVPPPHQPGPLPMSPRPVAPQLPGTPTMAHAIPHPPHTPQPPPSISSPPPTPSAANAPRLNTNARDFVPGGRPTLKVTIKSQDGMEVTLDALNKHSPQPPIVPIPPASPVVPN